LKDPDLGIIRGIMISPGGDIENVETGADAP
jgi:hypothetical protein